MNRDEIRERVGQEELDEITERIRKEIGERPDSEFDAYLRLIFYGFVFVIVPILYIVDFIGETTEKGVHQLGLTLLTILGLVLIGHRLRVYFWDKSNKEKWREYLKKFED